MRHALFAAIMIGTFLVGDGGLAPIARAAPAQEPRQPRQELEQAERLAREAARRLMWLLKMMIENIPQYEAPVITDEGDIIIRRKRKPLPAPPPTGDGGQTEL